jgi:uracil-DNA glycosylase family 4
MNKSKQIQNLIADISRDQSPSKINPNRWFDWENRANSPIMIIGQDWGPYIHLKKYIEDPAHDHFASSRTEKFIISTLNDIDPTLINSIFFTVAVVFTRTGHLFRGNENYNEAKSFEISYPYVSRQLDIVKPKVILTLGGLAFNVVNRHLNLNKKSKKLSEIVSEGKIESAELLIIPAYHPASFVSPEIQLQAWHTFSKHIKTYLDTT